MDERDPEHEAESLLDVDERLVPELMAEQLHEPVKTFSVGFREDTTSNELHDAQRIATLFNTDHHQLELSFLDDTVDLTELIWHLDEPVADLSALGFLALSQLARQHVTVALSGQGADELFAGYRKHRVAALLRFTDRVPAALRRGVGELGGRLGPTTGRVARVLAASSPAERLMAMSGQLENGAAARIRRGPLLESRDMATRSIDSLLGGVTDADPLATTLYLDAQLALPDDMLHYFDRTSMAHSLEVRVPFLDHTLVEWAATVPTNLKLRHNTTKHILKEAARPLLPEWVIEKRKIGFFRQASRGWVNEQLERALVDYLEAPDARVADFIDCKELIRLARSEPGRTQLVLAALMLELWLRAVVEKASAASVHP